MKPILRAKVNESQGITIFEAAFLIEDGREVAFVVFPTLGALRYRYVVRTPHPVKPGIFDEVEYFSCGATHPQVLEQWEQLPEAERGPAPLSFKDSDLHPLLHDLSNRRQYLLRLFWIPVPGQPIQLSAVPAAANIPDSSGDASNKDDED